MSIYEIEEKYSVKFVLFDTPTELSCYDTENTVILFTEIKQLTTIHKLGFKKYMQIGNNISDITDLSDDDVKVISVYMDNMSTENTEIFNKRTEQINQIKELGNPLDNLKSIFNKIDNKDYTGLTEIMLQALPCLRNYMVKLETAFNSIDNDTYEVRYNMIKSKLTEAEDSLIKYKWKVEELSSKLMENNSLELKQLLEEFKDKNDSLNESISELQEQLNESVDRNLYENYRSENEKLKQLLESMIDVETFNTYKSENESLKEQISALVPKEELETLKSENEILRERMHDSVSKESYEEVLKENEELNTQLSGMSINGAVSSSTSVFNTDNNSDLVKKLLSQITELRANQGIIETDLPFLTDQTPLLAQEIYVLKEIKQMPFMNAMLDLMRYKIDSTFTDTLVVVYDKLNNYYTQYKYKSKEFAINSIPVCGVVITNNITSQFLTDVCNIRKYKRIIFIDRLGMGENISCIKRAKYYYFINSNKDLVDFHLKPEICIANFTPKRADRFAGIIEAKSEMGNDDHSYRVSDLAKNQFIKSLFL